MKNIIICFITIIIGFNQNSFAQNPATKQIIFSGFADIVEDLLPSVVNISTSSKNNSSDSSQNEQFENFKSQIDNQKTKSPTVGSGFIVSKDGLILTNNHVIDEANEIIVSLNDKSKYKARIIGTDQKTDLALLKIDTQKELKVVKFGDSNKSRIGDFVIVIGNPYGLGGSVSFGIISARGRDVSNGQVEDFIQTDAAINKGNSGGPMFNVNGEVIGISTSLYSPSGGSVGIGFATPSSIISQNLKQLKDNGEVSRSWLGVSVQDISDEIAQSVKIEKTKGAFVIDVTPNGPAAQAGIIPSDIIIKFDNQEVLDMKFLPRIVAKTPIGKVVKVTIIRNGKLKILDVKVSKMKSEETLKKTQNSAINKKFNSVKEYILEMGLVEISDKNRKDNLKGLMVTDILPKSEAAKKGVALGDIILSANQIPLNSISDLKRIIEDSKKSTKKVFFLIRKDHSNYAIALSIN